MLCGPVYTYVLTSARISEQDMQGRQPTHLVVPTYRGPLVEAWKFSCFLLA